MGLAVGAVAIFPCAAGLCSYAYIDRSKVVILDIFLSLYIKYYDRYSTT